MLIKCPACDGQLLFLEQEERSTTVTWNGLIDGQEEQLHVRYDIRSSIYECSACQKQWQLAPANTASIFPVLPPKRKEIDHDQAH